MKNSFSVFCIGLMCVVGTLLLLPISSTAQFDGEAETIDDTDFDGEGDSTDSLGDSWDGEGDTIGTGGSTGGGKLVNPLKVNSLEELLVLILRVVVIFAVPIIIFFLIYAGFLFVTARGNETNLKTAKAALLWTVVGGVIVIGAEVLLRVIEGTVNSLR